VLAAWPAILAELRAGERDAPLPPAVTAATQQIAERWGHILTQVRQLTEDGVISGGRAAEVLGVDLATWRTLASSVEGEDPAELLAAAELRTESLEAKIAAISRRSLAERDRLAGELAAARGREGRLREALIWCFAASDLQPGGKAHVGWMQIRADLLADPPAAPAGGGVGRAALDLIEEVAIRHRKVVQERDDGILPAGLAQGRLDELEWVLLRLRPLAGLPPADQQSKPPAAPAQGRRPAPETPRLPPPAARGRQ
jgi:hypothetical protein